MRSVSVVIPTYNYAHFLGQAIDSALAQTWPPSEVIVVDDGSSDNTPELLARYGDRIRVVHQRNRGLASARNTGAELATGDLLAFLDADDIWLSRKLERQVQRFLADPELGLVHCGVEEIDSSGAVLGRCLDGLEGWVATELLLFRRPVIRGGGSGVIVPRTLFEAIEGFDRRLSTAADWDLYYRIACRQKIGFVPDVLLQYRRHGANMHRNIQAMEHDMLLAYAKAFSRADPQLHRLRRRCYGNLHTVLAGSFFAVGQYWGFIRHASRSLLLTPTNLPQFVGYPVRRWHRRSMAHETFSAADSRTSTTVG